MAVLIVMAAALVTAIVGVLQALSDQYPEARTSARERLIARNPMLNADPTLRWSRRARRVRVGRLATLVIGVALLIVTNRPIVASDDAADR